MACTYSSIEIQREPEFRVYKKCLFYDMPCADVRGSGKCPLLKRTPAGPVIAGAAEPRGSDKEALNEELRKFDNLPAVGGDFKGRGAAPKEPTKEAPKAKVGSAPSEVELLRAELSDFMDKIEPKKEATPKKDQPAKKKEE